jgi:hypothetical protein
VPGCSAAIAGSIGLSLEFWASINPSTTTYGQIAGFRNDIDCNFYVVQLINTNKLEIRLKTNAAKGPVSIYYNVSYSVWHHFALTFDNVTMTLFVDGAAVSTVPASGTIANKTAPLYIGTNALGMHFSGQVDEVALYSVALTAAQVSSHFASGVNAPVARSAVQINSVSRTLL